MLPARVLIVLPSILRSSTRKSVTADAVPMVTPSIAPPLISTVAIVAVSVIDTAPLADNVVNAPVEAELAPIAVPSISPAATSTLLNTTLPVP